MKSKFQKGDNVFDHAYGWGIISRVNIDTSDLTVNFHYGDIYYNQDGSYVECDQTEPTLSFTNYTLEGFSQERPERPIEKNTLVYYMSMSKSRWQIGYYCDKKEGKHRVFANQYKSDSAISEIGVHEISLANPLL